MEYLFEIVCPLGWKIRTTKSYWDKLVMKHPEISQRLEEVKLTVQNPIQIHKSKSDELIFLFYSELGKYWICIVVKKLEEFTGAYCHLLSNR